MHTSNTENTSLQSKLLDLTCTHANTLHATDCKDCIQLVNDITELFIEEGWVKVPKEVEETWRTYNQMAGYMAGQEWYGRFEKEYKAMEGHGIYFDPDNGAYKAARRASGIGEPQDD